MAVMTNPPRKLLLWSPRILGVLVALYWDKLVKAGATPTQCGWIKDPFGISWQIVPRRFTELIRDRNPGKVKAVMEAMMTMVKLDVAALERAYDEA
jgi:hypothetical protein